MPNQILAIVLGTWTTKVVHLEYRDEAFHLLNYLLQETPPQQSGSSPEALAQHLGHIREAIGTKVKEAVFVIGMTDCMVRLVDLPRLERSDLRRILKGNSKNYFQQDLSDYLFDCSILPAAPKTNEESGGSKKNCRVLAVGAKQQFIASLKAAAAQAGFTPIQITLSQVSLINAAAIAMPAVLEKEAIALLDLGFASTTISILVAGRPVLIRVVGIGGNTVTNALMESFNITYQVAEGIKAVMPEKVQAKLENILSTLAEELRAAINSVELHQEQAISQIFVSGGQARSPLIVEILQSQLGVPCRTWDATSSVQLDLAPLKLGQVAKDAPQLTVALGAAASWFQPPKVGIDLLAEQKEIEDIRRRDPVRRGARVSAILIFCLLLWAAYLHLKVMQTDAELIKYRPELNTLQSVAGEITVISKSTIETESRLSALQDHSTNRFLWAPVLNALQRAAREDVQVVRLSLDRNLVLLEAAQSPTKKPATVERITLSIQAKNFVGLAAHEQFMEAIASVPYFRQNLRKDDPILLKSRLPRQVDPSDPTKSFNLFTIECVFQERVVGND